MKKYLIHLSITIPVEADSELDVEVPAYFDYVVKRCAKKYGATGGVDIEESEG